MVTIEVTQRHIDEGEVGDCSLCPVARGTQDAFPGFKIVVGDDDIFIDEEGVGLNYATPSIVRDFISDFDNGRLVHPFTFTLPDNDLNGKPTPEART